MNAANGAVSEAAERFLSRSISEAVSAPDAGGDIVAHDGGDGTAARPKRKRKRTRPSAKRRAEKAASAAAASAAGPAAAGGAEKTGDAASGPAPKKRRARRSRQTRKPWSQMTWEEKQAVEERESIQEQEAERLRPQLPLDPNGHVPRGVNPRDYRPPAPRNTTQFLMQEARTRSHAAVDSDVEGGSDGDDELEDLGSGSMANLLRPPNPSSANDDGAPAASATVSSPSPSPQAIIEQQQSRIASLEAELASLREIRAT